MFKYIFITCLLFNATAWGQYSGYKQLTNTHEFQAQFSSANQKIQSIQCDFVQEKNLSMLTDKITSTGKFWYKRENKVRMEYLTPSYYLLVINGNMIKTKDGQKQNTISAKSNKMFEQINKMVVDCVRGNVFDNKSYNIRVYENSQAYIVELSPTAKGIQSIFKSINLSIDHKDYSIIYIDMREKSGDNTMIKMLHKQQNVNIADAIFSVQ
ncbi:MAG: outer membrane lipoprotein carrier protein LolA [Taibaiella sp.]|nr:outer membrane lipoprotein carrier protein LolA [Taibaiella sp.]